MNEYLEQQLVHDRLKDMHDAAHRAALRDQARRPGAPDRVRLAVGHWLIRVGARLTRNPAIAWAAPPSQ